ncbi:MAG: hypothetical protein J5I98_05170 [Phaeodactylibacter sp.]|nr:hypothetical protein [Phaeodactylibacter sp.]
MIEIFKTDNLKDDKFFYFSPAHIGEERGNLSPLSALALVTKDDKEFQKLLELTLQVYLQGNSIYAIMVERFPEYKSRLRSYAGLNYAWRKDHGEEGYFEKEFDLLENQSFFASILKLDGGKIKRFLSELVSFELVFGLLSEDAIELVENTPGAFLDDLFNNMITIDKTIWAEWQSAVFKYTTPSILLFRVHSDGQDRMRLEFFGTHEAIESMVSRALIPRLEEKFYLRRRQPGMGMT